MILSANDIINSVRAAGVVGAGGGGFPTYVKLNTKVSTIIANASECEPLLNTDKSLIKEKAQWLIEGIKLTMIATGASQSVIAVKKYYSDVIDSLLPLLPTDKSITIHPLHNYYPAGDEFLTVYDVTGKQIPEGGLPLHVNTLVCNVLSLIQIAQAVQGKPVTERTLTINGEVKTPGVFTVPIGSKYSELIEMAGGPTRKDIVLIDGGPMMGTIVPDINAGIAKTTSGIIVLPRDHFIIQMKRKTISQMVKLSKAACCQCSRCTDLCPRNLLGHELYPHMTMRTIDYNIAEPTKHITSSFLCSQCGVCEMIACDFMLLSPKKIFAEYKKRLLAKGIKNPHTRTKLNINSEYQNRKISTHTILKKLGLTQYSKKAKYLGIKAVNIVRIPINKHVGAPAKLVVQLGQNVKMGELIAASPKDQLGTVYHASISGKISDIGDSWIEVRK